MSKIGHLVLIDIFKNKIVLIYAIVLLIITWSVFMLEDTSGKGLLTLLNVVLLVVPLMSLLFSTIYLYNSAEFIELLVSQPVKRQQIWLSLYFGLSLSLAGAFVVATIIPLLLFCSLAQALMMTITGFSVTLVFISLGFVASIVSRDKAKGIGIAILMWLYFALLFDGLVLFLLFQFAEYPIEKPMVILSIFSPLDLARINILMQMDAAALMGYTGAVFKQYFGSGLGLYITGFAMLLWVIVPLFISTRIFKRRDL